MKVYQTNEIKNIALLGNDGSGKTTLTESLLFESGIIKRRGRITAKNTVSDYFPVEQEYGYSVFSTVYHVEWNGKKLNIIDCPGSDDFVGAAITALNVTDTAIFATEWTIRSRSRHSEPLPLYRKTRQTSYLFWLISLITRNVTMTMYSNSCVVFMALR